MGQVIFHYQQCIRFVTTFPQLFMNKRNKFLMEPNILQLTQAFSCDIIIHNRQIIHPNAYKATWLGCFPNIVGKLNTASKICTCPDCHPICIFPPFSSLSNKLTSLFCGSKQYRRPVSSQLNNYCIG